MTDNTLRKWKSKKKPAQKIENSNFKSIKRDRKRKTEANELEILAKKIKATSNKIESGLINLGTENLIKEFSDLPISNGMIEALNQCGFKKPTTIQKRSLVLSLTGDNLIAGARTGSGKTLAFVIPILEDLYRQQYSEHESIAALILVPTRELAYQIQLVFKRLIELIPNITLTASAITGGQDLSVEASLIARNQIVIATPGRLLQHLEQTINVNLDSLRTLVLDEADRMMDKIFKDQMHKIIRVLPENYQTLLFSATGKAFSRSQYETFFKRSVQNKTRKLHVISDELEEHGLQNEKNKASLSEKVPENLKQIYCVVKAEEKINFLFNFLKSKQKQKILIFVSTKKQVGYLHEIFHSFIQPGTLKIMRLRGSDSHLKRSAEFDQFIRKQSGAMIATDVAARGLDVSKTRINKNGSTNNNEQKAIDWVVHFDAPDTIETYIHRSGRTARAGSKGKSLLMVLPQEKENMLKIMESSRITVSEKIMNKNSRKPVNVTKQLQSCCIRDKDLHGVAKRAFSSYFDFLMYSKNRTNSRLCLIPLNIGKLNLLEFAYSFGLDGIPPLKHINIKVKGSENRSKQLGTGPNPFKENQLQDSDGDDEEVLTQKKDSQLTVKFDQTDIKNEVPIPKIKEGANVKSLNLEAEKEKMKGLDTTDKLSYKERKLARKKEQKAKRREQQLLLKQQQEVGEMASDDEGENEIGDREDFEAMNQESVAEIEDLEAMALKHIG